MKRPVEETKRKVTITDKIAKILSEMNLSDRIDKVDFVKFIYDDYDYFISRTFDVNFCKAKRLLESKPETSHFRFRTQFKEIIRIK